MKKLSFLFVLVCLFNVTTFAGDNPKGKIIVKSRKSVTKPIKNLCSFAPTLLGRRNEEGGCPSFSTCMNGCLREVGVSATTLVTCGGTCGTANVPLCALCIGWAATTVITCGAGCSGYPCGVGGGSGGGQVQPVEPPQN